MDGSCNSFTGAGCRSGPSVPPPSDRRRCNIGASGRGTITAGVPLTFPDGTTRRGYTNLSYAPMGLAPLPGWFWNIEIFASVLDDVLRWTVHQQVTARASGTRIDNGQRRSDTETIPYPNDEPTGARLVQNAGEKWLFWIDVPGLPSGRGVVPIDMELQINGHSWIEQGRNSCSVNWQIVLKWKNGKIDSSSTRFWSERESW